MKESDFNVKILDSVFGGMDQLPRDEGYDEAIHFDYAWIKSPGGGATIAGVKNDGTVCHNLLIQNVRFVRQRKFPYPTSIGNHKFTMSPSTGEAVPTEIHSHLAIRNCQFVDVGPTPTSEAAGATAISASQMERGTVNLLAFREVVVENNLFDTNARQYAFASRSNLVIYNSSLCMF